MHSPVTRYRYGDRDTVARRAHNLDTQRWHHQVADAAFEPAVRAAILAAVAEGASVPDAAEPWRLSQQAVYAYAGRHEEFAAELDAAQRAAAPDDTPHGSVTGYRWHGCRCRGCRAAKG